ncbi:MAG: APC family permease [Bryobacteraceae bacterium]
MPAKQFQRTLTRRDLIIYGLVILTPTAPYPVYGIVQTLSNGHAALSYLVALVAMLFTAASYGKMAGAFPSAGSTYTYALRALNPQIGFLAGWAMILDYFLIPLLSIIYAALTAERIVPAVPYSVWAIVFTAAIAIINVRGIHVTARAGTFFMVVMSASAVLFLFFAARWIVMAGGFTALFQWRGIFDHRLFSVHPLMMGASVATLSYIGFDAISTLAEDAIDPQRDISIATLLVCILQTVFCVVTVYLAALVWPDFHSFPHTETVILDIGKLVGGNLMEAALTFVLLVAGLASALTGQAGASRLLYGMGSDGVISRGIFAYVDPVHNTPTRSIYLMAAISLAGALLLQFQMAVELLNFGAFVGFILVNLSVIRHFYIRGKQRRGIALLTNLLFPLLGAIVCGYVWISLSREAILVGFAWMVIGFLYLAIRGAKPSVEDQGL